jgi:hypothetical protein
MTVCGFEGIFPCGRCVQPTNIPVKTHVRTAQLDIGQQRAIQVKSTNRNSGQIRTLLIEDVLKGDARR